jgi:hypothetical protein
MSNLSIRGIDPDLATTLKEQAQASGKSVNQLVNYFLVLRRESRESTGLAGGFSTIVCRNKPVLA